ncbi:MAG: amidophosphoribosyltransferase [Clostridia bacterium]|nr:amidophosphoribosyltransferase [Clostridia bacterium]
MANLHEECGVFGIWSPAEQPLAETVYYGLYALQHRGQEGCGIVVNRDGVFSAHKGLGTVGEVFTPAVLADYPQGSMAVGHVRYGTTGGNSLANCQPIVINHRKGKLALCHNGNLSNAYALREELELKGAIFHGTSDTEIIAYLITQSRLSAPSIQAAVSRTMDRLDGAFSLVMMSSAKLIAVRDPYGFRPLCYGKTEDGSYVVASESCALTAVGAEFIRDVAPGELIVIDEMGIHSDTSHCGSRKRAGCVFEYIYFARPDSVVDGISVHGARKMAGRLLAKRHPVEADLVVGVPDSGLDAALGYAQEAGIPYGQGMIKNKYIGRTFISPGQGNRVNQVKIKLSAIAEEVAGKRIVLIDDSIVRGTTSKKIVTLLREAGAKEIHMRISSPPFVSPCYYGTDVDSKEHLIACHHTVEEIADIIGADSLGYLAADDLRQMTGALSCCHACFGGEYPTPVPECIAKDRFERPLSERPPKKKK